MKLRDHHTPTRTTGQATEAGAQDLNNPQGGNPKAITIQLTRVEFKRISRDYKSRWTRPDGRKVWVVLREADGGGVQFVEVEFIKE